MIQSDVAEPPDAAGFAVHFPGLAVEGQGLPVVSDGGVVVGAVQCDVGEPPDGGGLAEGVSGLAVEGQGSLAVPVGGNVIGAVQCDGSGGKQDPCLLAGTCVLPHVPQDVVPEARQVGTGEPHVLTQAICRGRD